MLHFDVLKIDLPPRIDTLFFINQPIVCEQHLLELLRLPHLLLSLPLLPRSFNLLRAVEVLVELVIPGLDRAALQVDLAGHWRHHRVLDVLLGHLLSHYHRGLDRNGLDNGEGFFFVEGVIFNNAVFDLCQNDEFLYNVLHFLCAGSRMEGYGELGREGRIVGRFVHNFLRVVWSSDMRGGRHWRDQVARRVQLHTITRGFLLPKLWI